jgi:seryl-tRNA synthetase
MLDIKQIRNEPEKFRLGLEAKNAGAKLDELLKWDVERRECITKTEELKSLRNRVSEEIGRLKKSGQPAEDKVREMRAVGEQISALDQKLKEIETQQNDILITLPNIPHSSVSNWAVRGGKYSR